MQHNYGEILKKIRKSKKVSLRKLASSAGVTYRAIVYWESGERVMSLASAEKVFSALGYRIEIVPQEERE